jgi:hypothetical protein
MAYGGALTSCTTSVLTDPLLSPLAGNGGEVLTMALVAGSPALNAGVYVYQDTDGMLCYNTDGGTANKPKGSGIDLGAFELE